MNPPASQYRASSHRLGSDSVSRSSALKTEDFEYIRQLLREEAAIDLELGKGYFVEARLDVLATREGFPSSSDLVETLKLGKHDGLRLKAVEAMTQNETSFFRDARPFEELRRSILPDLIARRAGHRRLKIWSAACSSGQEPYSLALMQLEHFPELTDWDVSILASDLSSEMIDRARAGRYNQAEVNRGLPAALLIKYFRRDGLEWMIEEPIRRSVEFRAINLAAQWPTMAGLDLIVLRNVLIYLAIDGRRDILAKAAGALAPDGYLWLGGAETTINIDDRFERVEPECGSIYRLRRPWKH